MTSYRESSGDKWDRNGDIIFRRLGTAMQKNRNFFLGRSHDQQNRRTYIIIKAKKQDRKRQQHTHTHTPS